MAVMLSGFMLLRHLGEHQAADAAESALVSVLKEGKTIPADMGGTAGTIEFTNAIIDALQKA